LRKRNGWTLADVQRRTGIPPSTLSRIENSQISPTYDLLLRISTGLSLDLSQLLSSATETTSSTADQPGRRSVNYKNGGERVPMSNHTLRYLSTDLLHKQITPILCEYRARSLEEFGEFMRHEGEEFLYVIHGELELHTDCYAPLRLTEGESVYFDSRMGHAYISCGAQPCRALSVCTAPQLPKALAATAGAPVSEVSQTAVARGRSGGAAKRVRRRRSAGAGTQ
jgi:transcriptional regulator with XRE-family HTH domain